MYFETNTYLKMSYISNYEFILRKVAFSRRFKTEKLLKLTVVFVRWFILGRHSTRKWVKNSLRDVFQNFDCKLFVKSYLKQRPTRTEQSSNLRAYWKNNLNCARKMFLSEISDWIGAQSFLVDRILKIKIQDMFPWIALPINMTIIIDLHLSHLSLNSLFMFLKVIGLKFSIKN